MQATRQPLPLNGLFFRDENTGWAVGELGTILATRDGGRGCAPASRAANARRCCSCTPAPRHSRRRPGSGRRRRGLPGRRPACADPGPGHRLPGPGRRDRPVDDGGTAGRRRRRRSIMAVSLAAAPRHRPPCGFAQGLVRPARRSGRRTAAATGAGHPHVASRRPCHRLPDVSTGAAESLVAAAVREAFTRAADPRAFPEQLSHFGLKPWTPSKVYGLSPGRQGTGQPRPDGGAAAAGWHGPRLCRSGRGTVGRGRRAAAAAALLPAAGQYPARCRGASRPDAGRETVCGGRSPPGSDADGQR